PNNDPPSDEGKLLIKLTGQTEETNLFLLKNALESKDGVHKFKKMESFIGMIQNVRLRYEGKRKNFCKIKSIKITSNKGHEFYNTKSIVLRHYEEIVVTDKNKNCKFVSGEAKKNRQIMVQIHGEKSKSDLFPLKEAETNEDDLDEYSKTLNDLGKIKNVLVKYDDKEGNENAHFDYVEIIDPRGNSYKFLMDMNLSPGEDVMLPRKAGGKKNESDDTEGTEETVVTTETEDSKPKSDPEPIVEKKLTPTKEQEEE
ncbi:hypothetical protein BpHYR1_041211, partial [Brachionus plicatilis]